MDQKTNPPHRDRIKKKRNTTGKNDRLYLDTVRGKTHLSGNQPTSETCANTGSGRNAGKNKAKKKPRNDQSSNPSDK